MKADRSCFRGERLLRKQSDQLHPVVFRVPGRLDGRQSAFVVIAAEIDRPILAPHSARAYAGEKLDARDGVSISKTKTGQFQLDLCKRNDTIRLT